MKHPVDSLEDAIAGTSHDFPGGIRTLAEKMSVNPGTLYNKCNPGMPSHRLTLQEAVDLMHHSQDVRILEVLCRETHHACVPQARFRHIGDMVLFDAWTAADMEHGRTAGSIREALSDERIDENEYRGICAEMFTDFARELELLDRLNAFCNNASRQQPPVSTDLKQAVLETVQKYPDGLPRLAQKLGMREVDLHKKSSPDFPGECLSIQDTLKLMLETGNFPVLHAAAHFLKHACIPIPRYEGENDMALLDAWSSWSDERGDTVTVIHQALTDGSIDQKELAEIEVEMYRDFETELALLARLELMVQR
ncbi:MAG TPA: hypothetical protein ENJ80_08180 [Gammaproteobacteria bacterium]|nr:hypothetical protein [Gammaproteobacteria bacterium]